MCSKIKILFLCTGNSCRSQMAEGWAQHLKGYEIDAYSAGIEKHGINENAVKVMAEVGIDISHQRSSLIEELPVKNFDYVITLCGHANENCPFFPGKQIHEGFADPPKLAANAKTTEEELFHYRKIRDKIKSFIESLPDSLSVR